MMENASEDAQSTVTCNYHNVQAGNSKQTRGSPLLLASKSRTRGKNNWKTKQTLADTAKYAPHKHIQRKYPYERRSMRRSGDSS